MRGPDPASLSGKLLTKGVDTALPTVLTKKNIVLGPITSRFTRLLVPVI